jgi:hypothetical protein
VAEADFSIPLFLLICKDDFCNFKNRLIPSLIKVVDVLVHRRCEFCWVVLVVSSLLLTKLTLQVNNANNIITYLELAYVYEGVSISFRTESIMK